MKLSLAFLLALALTGPATVFSSPLKLRETNELHEVFLEFMSLVPRDKVIEIFYDYLENDSEVQKVVDYLLSNDFRQLVKKIESIDDVMKFFKYLDESGLDIFGLMNEIHKMIGLPPLVPRTFNGEVRRTGGMSGLIADVKAVLPVDKIKNLYQEKLKTSPAFAELVKRLSSPRFQELIDALRKNPEYNKIVDFLRKSGVDVDHIKDLLAAMFGLKFPSLRVTRQAQNLQDDVNDFVAILPIDEIMQIGLNYMDNDPEVQEVMEYLGSPAFHGIVREVEAMQEARNVLAYLQASGLDAYGFLNTLHDILGIPHFKPNYLAPGSQKMTGGIAGLIADVKAVLPLDAIKALYHEKLEQSQDFANLIKRLGSPEFQKFVDAVLAKDEARAIIKSLKEHHVDVGAIADLLTSMLGLRFPKSRVARASDELMTDLQDFLALVPLEDVIDVALDHMLNDPEVQKAAQYVRSQDFKKLATAAQQNNEFRSFLGYLDESGLPASLYLNTLNDFLGLARVDPSTIVVSRKAGGGVRGMLDAIEALLPQDKIKALYDYKKKNSKAFAYLIERLEAAEFQKIVDELAANKDFQNLGHQAASFGIDLQAIVDFFKRVFGIDIPAPKDKVPSKSLEDDLQDFVALVPAREIRRVVIRYIVQDKEVQDAVKYVRSDEFKQLIRDLNDIKEYHELLKALAEAGLDVYTYIDVIHKIIGMTSDFDVVRGKPTAGIAGMINEIKALLPGNKIKDLYHEKVKSSTEFKKFVELIGSKKFQTVTDQLFANKIFQDILHKLQGHGIDMKVIADFFLRVFGITTPPGIID